MPGRPNFESLVIDGPDLVVSGVSDGNPPPVDIRVFVGQGAHVGKGNTHFTVDKITTSWQATFDAAGFTKGEEALAFGVEIRENPFEATSWTQMLEVK
jgi:hypothetical protein